MWQCFLKCRSSGTLCHWLKAVYWWTPANHQVFLYHIVKPVFVLYYKTVFYLQEILYFVCYIILKYFFKLLIIIFKEINTSDSTKILAWKKKSRLNNFNFWKWVETDLYPKNYESKTKTSSLYQQKKSLFGLQFIFETLYLVDFTNVQHCFYSSLLQRNAHFVLFYEWNREPFFQLRS